ncbi:MAG: LmeA family phospholipid-binding protein [Solirubrobacterales bacterium]|nr:LmeA family phospholipid-binding protein [Solirubrobacterales bacterium]
MRGRAPLSKRTLLLSVAGAVLVLLVLAQVLLPRIAASEISSRVSRYGEVASVSVSAWPALKLLWGHADSVKVRARSLALDPAQAAKLVWEGRDVGSEDVSAESVKVGSLQLSDATLRKRGSWLSAFASADQAAVKAALPEGFEVRLLSSRDGQVEVQASGGLFGVGTGVDAVALASGGRLVAHPLGFLIEGLQLAIFSDPHVYVEGVSASVPPSGGYRLGMSASLR